MCTVSWLEGLGLVELFTNRDEQRSRASAEPPFEWCAADGTRFLAPRDPAGGGTWVAVNEHGLVLCLVNHYQAADPVGTGLLSRGSIVVDLAAGRDLDEVDRGADRLELDHLRGFRLLALQPDVDPLLVSWDGRDFTRDRGVEVRPPLISSSVRMPEVEVARRAAYQAAVTGHGGETPEALAAFHASRSPEPGPLAVSMSRPDACTVSHTRVRVEPDRVEMAYVEGPPDGDASPNRLSLPRHGCGRAR